MKSITMVEHLCNAVTSLIGPELYDHGSTAIDAIKTGQEVMSPHENLLQWPSIFTAIQVIVNRKTAAHRDDGGCPTHFDLLLSAGTHTSATLRLNELNFNLSYKPGTLVAICGRIMTHEVPDWDQGDRVCIAHLIKDAVHGWFHLPWPLYTNQQKYFSLFGK